MQHFKLALAKKEDSQNAIERALPLSWILGQWRDGLDLLQKVKSYAGNERNIDALKIAFLIRDNKNKIHLYGQSHSSVLNGMLEGPYFESVFFNLIKSLK